MIQSVTSAGVHRVYDIEVEGYHNFIASEVCVHNSSQSPNLQNIPSHAIYIRHMFRATAATDILEGCEYDEISDEVSIDISKFNKVYVNGVGLVTVENLLPGQEVKLLENKEEVYRVVKKISVADTDACVRHVVF